MNNQNIDAQRISEVAVVIASHDKSSDLWDPLIEMLQRNWIKCTYPLYLVCNHAKYSRLGVLTITVGQDISWSDTLLAAIQRIQEEYILLWIDDHFLVSNVENETICNSIREFIQLDGNYLRLHSLPKPDESTNEYFGKIISGAIYRTSTVASVWRKRILRELLRSGESAWDFETDGSLRSDAYEGFYSTWRSCFQIENLLIKGKIRKSSQRHIERMLGRPLGVKRPAMTCIEESTLTLKVIANRMLIRLPRRLARVIRSISKTGRGQC